MKISLQKVIRIVSLIVFIACTAVLAVYIIGDIRDSESNKNVDKLKDAEVTVPDVLDEYAGLYAENPDTIGWLKIDGTELDNVVMFSRHDNEKYLYTDFYGNSSYRGCLFVDGWCDVLTSDNIIVYGHHMKDGSMFGVIVDYQSDEFYKQHKYISFDTIYEKQTYEVVAAIQTELPSDGEEGFRYNEYTGSDEKTFAEYAKFIDKNKLYDTGVRISPGDKLLTLSTCTNILQEERYTLQAVLVSHDE